MGLFASHAAAAGKSKRQIPGCQVLVAPLHRDECGGLGKPFSIAAREVAWPSGGWAECYWSVSRRGVVRGFHLQQPPRAYEKLVFCVQGEVFDALLDLRRGSPTFGAVDTLRLSANDGSAILMPEGVGHAFQAMSDEAVLVYLVSSAYDPTLDAGVRWNSAGVRWPLPPGPISARDSMLPELAQFESPFEFEE